MKTLLIAVLLGCNLAWFAAYNRLDLAYMQEMGLRDEADTLLRGLPDPTVYRLTRTAGDELEVYCLNQGDATIVPNREFGRIEVSCGK